ncbi:MAG: hypothetical protein AAFY28_16115, partial [Actinomycetota bacterium]
MERREVFSGAIVAGLLVVVSACGGGSDGGGDDATDGTDGATTGGTTDAIETTDGEFGELDIEGLPSLEELDEEGGDDQRPALMSELGTPDAFRISFDEVDGRASRYETWIYHEAASQVELIDGEVLWTVSLDELPDGTIYPLAYNPNEFTLLAGK